MIDDLHWMIAPDECSSDVHLILFTMSLHSAEVVILAGGASRRMGSPKALLHFSPDANVHYTLGKKGHGQSEEHRETFLDHLLSVYREAGVERATVIWSESARRDARVLHAISHPQSISLKTTHVFHDDPSADRLASVMRGLQQTEESSMVFLQDVDRPFATPAVIRALGSANIINGNGYAAPDVFGHAGHPLLLSASAVHSILNSQRNTTEARSSGAPITLRDLLLPLPGTLVTIGSMEEAFFLALNINTPSEYRRFFAPDPELQELPFPVKPHHPAFAPEAPWHLSDPSRHAAESYRSATYAR